MPSFMTRVALASGTTLRLGDKQGVKWFEEDPFPVGLIISRPEVSEQIVVKNERGEEDDGPVLRTPPHCDVWLMPDAFRYALFQFYYEWHSLQKMPSTSRLDEEAKKVPNLYLRRVPALASPIAFTEEIVPTIEALDIFEEFFAEEFDLPEEDEPRAQNNGPVARAAG